MCCCCMNVSYFNVNITLAETFKPFFFLGALYAGLYFHFNFAVKELCI